MKARVDYLKEPLVNLDLRGLHLIEASAGTGKTWTLSSLMVRILVEKYMPRQVIATTFTRAAAAELKSRIRKRLVGIFQQAKLWEGFSPTEYRNTQSQLNDPLEKMIFAQFNDPLIDQKNFNYLVNRLGLVIDSLDELFVGTIDSFTQKLLREFSFESGEVVPRLITDDEKHYSYQIVHDLLRAWLQAQPQELIDLLLLTKNLGSVEDYISTVQSTLNFGQAKLQQIQCPRVDLSQFNDTLTRLLTFTETDFSTLRQFYLKTGEYHKFADKNAFAERRFVESLPELISHIRSQGTAIYFSTHLKHLSADIDGIFLTKGEPRKKLLNKCSDEIQKTLYDDPVFQTLQKLVDLKKNITLDLDHLDQYLRFHLSTEVKKQLPQVLTQANETTFSQQIRTLDQALVQDKGQLLARAIHQRYPIILVDEFQDTNQEQDNVLRAVWRDVAYQEQGCFIAVGDPKQAIYGFRGGDILTYLNAFNDIANKSGKFYRLDENFRSVPKLVAAVDALFLRQADFSENIEYYAASSGKPDAMPLFEQGQPDDQPLRWLQLNDQQNDHEAYFIAQKIAQLLAQSQNGKLYLLQGDQEVKICADDIAVLAASNRELDQVQKQLESMQIDVNRSALHSVFESQSAQTMGAILQAIIQPDRSAVLKRALLTSAIGMTLADFNQFEQYPEQLNEHIQTFRQARQSWQQKGFLTAWQYLAEHYQIWVRLAQYSNEQAERSIVNMRHLVEVLSQHSYQYPSVQHLMQWYQLQLGSPAQREWELERKLSNASGVQLMTIHKSKGLEFKIVFLMHANKEIKAKNEGLAFYEEQQQSEQPTRIIAISKKMIANNETALKADLDKAEGENHRLWYVALTRASYRIYAVLHHQDKAVKLRGATDYWYSIGDQIFEHPYSCVEAAEPATLNYQKNFDNLPQLAAQPYPNIKLYPKTRTSFSYLAAHLKYQHKSIDILADIVNPDMPAADESLHGLIEHSLIERALIVESLVFTEKAVFAEQPLQLPLAWIKQNFPKGAIAGNCLHEIFEQIDFHNKGNWEKVISKSLAHYGLWQPLLDKFKADHDVALIGSEIGLDKNLRSLMLQWIDEIVKTPIQHDEQNFSLRDILPEHKLVEFPFFIALDEDRFDVNKIHQLFVKEGIDMPMFEAANTAKYLNGAIDLVYFDGQQYHIADYKGNYLGPEQEHYQIAHIESSMTQASYWLQAAIYLVVLHRYLKKNLTDYDIQQHLGGASYLYLRGMSGETFYGVKYWQPHHDFILALDHSLGYASHFRDEDHSIDKSVDNYV